MKERLSSSLAGLFFSSIPFPISLPSMNRWTVISCMNTLFAIIEPIFSNLVNVEILSLPSGLVYSSSKCNVMNK